MIDMTTAVELSGFHTKEGEYLRVLADKKGAALFEHFTAAGEVAKAIEGEAEELLNLLEGARASVFGGCADPSACAAPNCGCGAEKPAETAETPAQAADPAPSEIEEL